MFLFSKNEINLLIAIIIMLKKVQFIFVLIQLKMSLFYLYFLINKEVFSKKDLHYFFL